MAHLPPGREQRAAMPMKGNGSRLFQLPDKESSKLDKYWAACWQKHRDVLMSGDPGAVEEFLANPASSTAHMADAAISALYGALAMGPDAQRRCAECLMQHTRDRHQTSVEQLRKLVLAHYNQLHSSVRPLLLKLAADLCEREAAGIDGLLLALLRQVAIGDLSEANIWLASTLLHTLRKAYAWLTGPQGPPALLQSVLYKYLRLLPDVARSSKNAEQVLAKHSTALCVSILKEHWSACAGIGRDLARALQLVCALPEFKPVWQALLAGRSPSGEPVEGQDDALSALLCTRSPPHLLASAVTQEMEKELYFMMTKVKMGNQLRYQHHFQTRFLSSPESESLLPDIVRYICGVYHPPNQILASDVVPRWALVGWLMQLPRRQTSIANLKLALVYDLLLFQPGGDSIMNIEPAMLLMVHSIQKYPTMTNSLLEFLILAKDHYNPARRPLTNRGFIKGMTALVQRRVIPSLDVLAKAEEVAPELREIVLTTFRQFCSSGEAPEAGSKRLRDESEHGDPQDQQPPPAKRPSTAPASKPRRASNSDPSLPGKPSPLSTLRGAGDASARSQFHSDNAAPSSPSSAAPRAGSGIASSSAGLPTVDASAASDGAPPPISPLQGVRGAAFQLREEVSDLLKGDRDADELNIPGAVRDLLAAVEADHRKASGDSRPLGAESPALTAAADAVLGCATELHEAGVAVFDNLPGDGSHGAQAQRSPLAATADCLGGALFEACSASLSKVRAPQEGPAALLLARLRSSSQPAVADLGPCLLSHVLAGGPAALSDGGAARSAEREDEDDGASDSFSPAGDASAERCALYQRYAVAAAADKAPGVLAEDLRGCLCWGLGDARRVLLAMLEGRPDGSGAAKDAGAPSAPLAGLEQLASGNAAVAEVAAAVLMPADVLRLTAGLASGRAFLCLGLPRGSGTHEEAGGGAVARALAVVKKSAAWDAHSQATLWALLGPEAARHGPAIAEELAAGCLKELSEAAARGGMDDDDESDDDDEDRDEARAAKGGGTAAMAAGLAAFLRPLTPSKRLVHAARDLPAGCRDLAAAVLSAWQVGIAASDSGRSEDNGGGAGDDV